MKRKILLALCFPIIVALAACDTAPKATQATPVTAATGSPIISNTSGSAVVDMAGTANVAMASCVQSLTTQANAMDANSKGMFLMMVPQMCRNSVVTMPVKDKASVGEMLWDFGKTLVQVHYGYKGQALIWDAVSGLVSRTMDSNDNAVNHGFNTANTAIEMGPTVIAPPASLEVLTPPSQ